MNGVIGLDGEDYSLWVDCKVVQFKFLFFLQFQSKFSDFYFNIFFVCKSVILKNSYVIIENKILFCLSFMVVGLECNGCMWVKVIFFYVVGDNSIFLSFKEGDFIILLVFEVCDGWYYGESEKIKMWGWFFFFYIWVLDSDGSDRLYMSLQ